MRGLIERVLVKPGDARGSGRELAKTATIS